MKKLLGLAMLASTLIMFDRVALANEQIDQNAAVEDSNDLNADLNSPLDMQMFDRGGHQRDRDEHRPPPPRRRYPQPPRRRDPSPFRLWECSAEAADGQGGVYLGQRSSDFFAARNNAIVRCQWYERTECILRECHIRFP